MPRKPFGSPGLAAFVLAVMCACGGSDQAALELAGETMGTTYHVTLHPVPAASAANELARRIDALLARINGRMSTYAADSELSRFNASPSTDWFELSQETLRVLAEAQRVHQLSNGAFDVTVGPAVNLWGFGPGAGEPRVPTADEIAVVSAGIGQSLLELRAEPPAARKRRPDVYVDLSAIAKGYAVDEIATLLDEIDVAHYLVEIGGELRARGTSQRGDHWRVAVEKPLAGERSVQRILPVSNTAMATSGNYRNFFEHAGQRYSHTIDPRTARPVAHTLASVTVFHPSAMTADALATALTVLDADTGLALANQLDIAALFIVRENDELRELSSRAFRNRMGES